MSNFSCSSPSLLVGDIITVKQKQCAPKNYELTT